MLNGMVFYRATRSPNLPNGASTNDSFTQPYKVGQLSENGYWEIYRLVLEGKEVGEIAHIPVTLYEGEEGSWEPAGPPPHRQLESANRKLFFTPSETGFTLEYTSNEEVSEEEEELNQGEVRFGSEEPHEPEPPESPAATMVMLI